MPWSNPWKLSRLHCCLCPPTNAECHGLACRVCTGTGQGRMHLVTLQLLTVSFFITGKIKRTCIVQPKGWMLTADGWYQDSSCAWVLTCTAYPEVQEAPEVDQLLLPPENPSGCEKPTHGALFNCCWMRSSRTVLIFLSAITLRIVQLFLSTLCPNILYVL